MLDPSLSVCAVRVLPLRDQVAKHQQEDSSSFSSQLLICLFSNHCPSLPGERSQQELLGLEHLLALCQHCEIKGRLDNAHYPPHNGSIFKLGVGSRTGTPARLPGKSEPKELQVLLTSKSTVHWPQGNPWRAGVAETRLSFPPSTFFFLLFPTGKYSVGSEKLKSPSMD